MPVLNSFLYCPGCPGWSHSVSRLKYQLQANVSKISVSIQPSPTHSTPKFGHVIGILTLTCSESNSWYSPHFYSFTSVSHFSKWQCDSVSEIPNFGVILDSFYAFPLSNPSAISTVSTLKMYSKSGHFLLLHHYGHQCFSRPFQESCNRSPYLYFCPPSTHFPHSNQLYSKNKLGHVTPFFKIPKWLFITLREQSKILTMSYKDYCELTPPTLLSTSVLVH